MTDKREIGILVIPRNFTKNGERKDIMTQQVVFCTKTLIIITVQVKKSDQN